MAYLKPPFFVRRVFNPIAMRFGISGARALAVPGRRTGEMHTVPVVPVDRDGTRYVVSARGEADWVRNLRAAGGRVELRSRTATETFHAVEVPGAERPPIIADYRKTAGKAVDGYFKKLPDPQDHPVFRLEPASTW